MKNRSPKRVFFLALIFFALGIIFNTALKETANSFGTVCIALGGFFLIVSLAWRNKIDKNNKK